MTFNCWKDNNNDKGKLFFILDVSLGDARWDESDNKHVLQREAVNHTSCNCHR